MGWITTYNFVLFLVAAFVLWRMQHDLRLLAGGLFVLAVDGALFKFVPLEWQLRETLYAWGPWIYAGGGVLVVLGAFAAGRPGGTRGGGGQTVKPIEGGVESFLIPRNDTNSYSRATAIRDELCSRLEAIASSRGVTAIAYKSHFLDPSVWVKFVFSKPLKYPDMSLPGTLIITIDRFDFHRFEHLLTVDLNDGASRRVVRGVIDLGDRTMEQVIFYLTHEQRVPLPQFRVVRSTAWQFWLPKNEVVRVRRDWFQSLGYAALVPLFLVPIVGWALAILLIIALLIRARGRKYLVLTTGKPSRDPRVLRRLDFWQANISGLGARADEVRQLLIERLTAKAGQFVAVENERIWYYGVDGKVEREQIVLTHRRALGFVHLQGYQDELYIGWDTHVNVGTWIEESLAKGIDRDTGQYVLANRIVAATQVANEYDLDDANFLTEWLHATIVRVIRLKMEEHKIDQEIDFNIQRESRKSVLSGDGSAAEEGDRGLGHGLRSRLKRVG